MRSPTGLSPLDDHHVTRHCHPYFSFERPACFSMAFNVPGGTSRLGLPATVTVPGLLGCLYCRWLPRVRASRHPSSVSNRISSPTFTRPRVSRWLPCNARVQRRAAQRTVRCNRLLGGPSTTARVVLDCCAPHYTGRRPVKREPYRSADKWYCLHEADQRFFARLRDDLLRDDLPNTLHDFAGDNTVNYLLGNALPDLDADAFERLFCGVASHYQDDVGLEVGTRGGVTVHLRNRNNHDDLDAPARNEICWNRDGQREDARHSGCGAHETALEGLPTNDLAREVIRGEAGILGSKLDDVFLDVLNVGVRVPLDQITERRLQFVEGRNSQSLQASLLSAQRSRFSGRTASNASRRSAGLRGSTAHLA